MESAQGQPTKQRRAKTATQRSALCDLATVSVV